MSSSSLKLYRVKSINVWPYEDVQSIILVDPASRANVAADPRAEESFRIYRRHPDQFISLTPMIAYDDSWEGTNGPEISPYQLNPQQPLAYQIEYVLYQSHRASDYAKVRGLVKRIKQQKVDLSALPPQLRPQRMITQADDASHPVESRRLEGTTPPARPTSTFFVMERSGIPYINHHTIPDGIDYELVQAAIVSYDFYDVAPVYRDLLERLRTYCDWYDSLLAVDSEKKEARG